MELLMYMLLSVVVAAFILWLVHALEPPYQVDSLIGKPEKTKSKNINPGVHGTPQA